MARLGSADSTKVHRYETTASSPRIPATMEKASDATKLRSWSSGFSRDDESSLLNFTLGDEGAESLSLFDWPNNRLSLRLELSQNEMLRCVKGTTETGLVGASNGLVATKAQTSVLVETKTNGSITAVSRNLNPFIFASSIFAEAVRLMFLVRRRYLVYDLYWFSSLL